MNVPQWSTTENGKEWDEFVLANGGSVFHTWAWRKVREGTGEKPFYLVCRDTKGTIIAVCPFFYQPAGRHLSRLESLNSTPFGGPVIGDRIQQLPEIISSLRKAVHFSPTNPVVSLRLRVHQQNVAQILMKMGVQYDIREGIFVLSLASNTRDEIWKNYFQKHDRQAVKFYEERSDFKFATSEAELASYVTLHQETARRVRGTIRSLEYLRSMRANFGERFKVAIVTFDDSLLAGFAMISDTRSSTVHLGLNIGYSRTRNIHSPLVFMNWKIVGWACDNGFRFVDLGSASMDSNDPVHKLKGRFGAEILPVYRFTIPTLNIPQLLSKFRRTLGRATPIS